VKNGITTIKIGTIIGEGIGEELFKAVNIITDAVSKKEKIEFKFEQGPDIKFPIKSKRGVVNNLYKFYEDCIKMNIPILSGPLSGGLVYSLRKRFDLFIKIVPILSLLPNNDRLLKKDIDILLLRQNNSGDFFGRNKIITNASGIRVAVQNIRYSELEIKRLAESSLKLAQQRKSEVSVFLKRDGFKAIGRLWEDVFQNIKDQYFEHVKLNFCNPDMGICEVIRSPENFDIIVTTNEVGDIATDVLITIFNKSRGMGCSGNFNEKGFGSYQTVHGGAVDIAGKNIANPIGHISALAMLLEYSYGLTQIYNDIHRAIKSVLSKGYRTFDIGDSNSKIVDTLSMASFIANEI